MLVVSVAFYGMSTFEGPLMSIKAVNSLSHYTDWTIGHVHSGALGWVGFVSFGAIYCLVPWLWNRAALYSKLVEWHFWIATLGIVLYITAMWVSGIMQGLMWRAYDSLGFLEVLLRRDREAMHPFYVIRALGGVLFLTGSLIMAYNLWRTVVAGRAAVDEPNSRARRGPRPRHPSRIRRRAMSWKHAIFEKNSIVLLGRHPDGRLDRRPRADRPALLPREHDREGEGHAALHAARARPAATSTSARAATTATAR
jgi:heme/copper-type cytochrome/quinol oxidase subunit 1